MKLYNLRIGLFAFLSHPAGIGLTIFCATGAVCASSALIGMAAWLILLCSTSPTYDLIVIPATCLRFFGIARAGFRYLERLLSHSAIFKLLGTLRVRFFKSLYVNTTIQEPHSRSALFTRALFDIEMFKDSLIRIVLPVGVCFVTIVCALLYLMPQHFLLGKFFAIACSITVGIGFILFLANRNTALAIAQARDATNRFFIECSYGAVELALALRCKDWYGKGIAHINEEHASEKKRIFLDALAVSLSSALGASTLLAATIISALLVATNKIPSYSIAVIPLVCQSVFEMWLTIPTLAIRIDATSASAKRLSLDTLLKNNRALLAENYNSPFSSIPTVRIQNVTYSYSPQKKLLENATLCCEPFSLTFIRGKSGSGKSTLIDLLTGFLTPHKGTIYLNDTSIADITPQKLQSVFSVVEQVPFFFADSIAENFKLVNPQLSDTEMTDAIVSVALESRFGQAQQALSYILTEGGSNLSVGERQKLACARALLSHAPILILDEPTAGMDSESEQIIISLLRQESKKRTVILITHHKELIKAGDNVATLM